MESLPEEKRRAQRLPLVAGTSLTVRGLPLTNPGVTVNVSASGVLLRFQWPVELEAGQTVICDFAPPEVARPELDVPDWAQATVVRVEGNDVALEFISAWYEPGESEDLEETAA